MGTAATHIDHIKRSKVIILTLTIVLLSLWLPVVIDKISGFRVYSAGILAQPFPRWFSRPLVYLLPVLELLTAVMLLFECSRFTGFILSFILMLLFTGYIGIALLGTWEQLPCGCGSVISRMGWTTHFWFNLSFLILSAYGVYLLKKIRGGIVGNGGAKGLSAKRPSYHS